ncbi:hypothetical protein R3P38DRAFT_2461218, partial [Favolaschia claudopus]
RTDQIAFHTFTKLFFVVHAARICDRDHFTGNIDNWFNLETPVPQSEQHHISANDLFMYHTISSNTARPPPFVVQIVLAAPADIPLVHMPTGTCIPAGTRFTVEEWASVLRKHPKDQGGSDILPGIVEQETISLFRTVYAFLRVLPMW